MKKGKQKKTNKKDQLTSEIKKIHKSIGSFNEELVENSKLALRNTNDVNATGTKKKP